jgi:hypothetical protein
VIGGAAELPLRRRLDIISVDIRLYFLATKPDEGDPMRSLPRSPRARSRLLSFAMGAVVLWLAPAAGAYRVIFKDGSSLMAIERYQVQGELAVIILESGTRTTVPVSEIDAERTEQHNRTSANSTAVVIEGRSQRMLEMGERPEQPQTLRDLILERRQSAGSPQPAAPATEQPPRVRTTEAGFHDLASMQRRPLDPDVAAELGASLRAHGLARFQLFAGTAPERALVEVTADDRGQVFTALEAASAAVVALHEQGSEGLVLEVLLRSSQRSPAGMFTLAFENAALLAKDRMTPGEFFVHYVEF